MTVVEWFKVLWPVGVVIAGVVVRLEIGQALNKQKHRTLERDIEREKEDRKDDINSVHARVERHEGETHKYLAEIRNDIKTLLSRQS